MFLKPTPILVIAFFFFAGIMLVTGQTRISGIVADSETGVGIENVHVHLNQNISIITNKHGNFSLEYPGTFPVTIRFSHTAYSTFTYEISAANKAEDLKINLSPKTVVTAEVEVRSDFNSDQNTITGSFTLSGKELSESPAILGETDVMRPVMAMPGVQSVNEGVTGLIVRGGSPGQNAIFLDDIELLNPFHLMGTFSVFNPLLTNNVTVFKGSAPVHHPSKLSSSILVETFNYKDTAANFQVNIGTLSSNIALQGESENKKLYYAFGLRRTSLELYKTISKPLLPEEENYFNSSMYSFYDLNGKINYRTKKGLLSLSVYAGKDHYEYLELKTQFNSNIEWGNQGLSFKYSHSFSPKLLGKYLLTYNRYNFGYTGKITIEDSEFATTYERYSFNNTYRYRHNKHLLHFGFETSLYNTKPLYLTINTNNTYNNITHKFQNTNLKLFVGDNFRITDRLSLYGGINFELFSQFGPYLYLANEETEDDIVYNNNAHIVSYPCLAPIAHINYALDTQRNLKISYSHTYQNIHLGSLASIPLPADVWMPSTLHIKPEDAHQVTLGYYYENKIDGLEFYAELFAKKLNKQLIFVPDINQTSTQNFEDLFILGKGKSAGLELYARKQWRKGHLQVAYTLSKTRQNFNNKWFNAKYDRPHDLNILGSYQLKPQLRFFANWVFASGITATLPEQAYWEMGLLNYLNSETNAYRYPPFHRLDIGMDWELQSNIFQRSVLNFSIINVYNRANPYFIYYTAQMGENRYDIHTKAVQVSLFPILPSISWRFSF